MRLVALTGMIVCLSLGSVAEAQDLSDQAPRAELVIQGSPRAALTWRGEGAGRAGVAICLSSTTGRYALDIASATGQGLTGASSVEYSIRLESNGVVQSARISRDRPMTRFEGQVAPDRSCDRGPNARLVVSVESDQALTGLAGEYSDQVNLSATPL